MPAILLEYNIGTWATLMHKVWVIAITTSRESDQAFILKFYTENLMMIYRHCACIWVTCAFNI
jgi:hypothetical protein